jgi:hypothetical protein
MSFYLKNQNDILANLHNIMFDLMKKETKYLKFQVFQLLNETKCRII